MDQRWDAVLLTQRSTTIIQTPGVVDILSFYPIIILIAHYDKIFVHSGITVAIMWNNYTFMDHNKIIILIGIFELEFSLFFSEGIEQLQLSVQPLFLNNSPILLLVVWLAAAAAAWLGAAHHQPDEEHREIVVGRSSSSSSRCCAIAGRQRARWRKETHGREQEFESQQIVENNSRKLYSIREKPIEMVLHGVPEQDFRLWVPPKRTAERFSERTADEARGPSFNQNG